MSILRGALQIFRGRVFHVLQLISNQILYGSELFRTAYLIVIVNSEPGAPTNTIVPLLGRITLLLPLTME